MPRSIKIDPLTRIEGHLAIRVEVESNRVVEAFCAGEMFRGFEVILQGRDPLDAQQITQRICGVCPISHGMASILAQEHCYQVAPPTNGRIVRNLIQVGNTLMSHIMHFYVLSALDFLDVTAITQYAGHDPQLQELKAWVQAQLASTSLFPAAPFLPRYDGQYARDVEVNITGVKHYLEALNIRRLCHTMTALFGGKLPHAPTLMPGGVTEHVTIDRIAGYRSMLTDIRRFIDQAYLPDVLAVAQEFPHYWEIGRGHGNFLAYGVYPESDGQRQTFLPGGVLINDQLSTFEVDAIREDVTSSFFTAQSGGPPSGSQTIPEPHKANAYSWIKTPRYNGQALEVGPLARLLIAYRTGKHETVKGLLDKVLQQTGHSPDKLVSVMGRHLARALECKIIADRCAEWVEELVPDRPTFTDFDIPDTATGVGLTEAPRGALGHWIDIKQRKIKHYQCVVPTTWNCAPRDADGTPGTVEQALIGTPVADANNPIEAVRVVRSFDPCLACAVH